MNWLSLKELGNRVSTAKYNQLVDACQSASLTRGVNYTLLKTPAGTTIVPKGKDETICTHPFKVFLKKEKDTEQYYFSIEPESYLYEYIGHKTTIEGFTDQGIAIDLSTEDPVLHLEFTDWLITKASLDVLEKTRLDQYTTFNNNPASWVEFDLDTYEATDVFVRIAHTDIETVDEIDKVVIKQILRNHQLLQQSVVAGFPMTYPIPI